MRDKITLPEIMELEPCLGEEEVKLLMKGQSEWTALEIITAEHVPVENRIWLLLNGGFFDDADLRMMAAAFAEHALHHYENVYPDDKRPRQAIEAARLFACGEILFYAAYAASNAAYAAFDAAANAAAYAAANAAYAAANAANAAANAAYAAACVASATSNAAYATSNASAYAAYGAACAAEYAKEREYQLSVIKIYAEAK